jgi:uncharacterized membrane protein YdjX (TVP38/TMEM64 family)
MALFAFALPLAAAAAVLLPHSPSALRELLVAAGPLAPLIALAAWVLLTPILFPGTVLAAAGGLAFGVAGGAALALGGAVAGGLAAFVLGRTAARGLAERLVARSGRLARLDALLGRRGFAAILAVRLMPGVPVGGLHYAAGASRVGTRAFAGAIVVGAVLRTVPYAVLGTGLATGSAFTIAVAGASIVLGALFAAVLVRQLRRAPNAVPAIRT